MKLSKIAINLCIIPILCVLPMFGLLSCSDQRALTAGNAAFDLVGDTFTGIPESFHTAAPYLQQDLENLWNRVAVHIEVAGEEIGVAEPEHPLAEAQAAREMLISGASFDEVLAAAQANLTEEDLQNISTDDIGALNGILPFEIDLESCGGNLAEVLNSLDIGQVSAVLKSDVGYHIIQVLNRNGGRVQIGHVVFEIDPETAPAEEPTEPQVAEETDPLTEAISRLADAIAGQEDQ